MEIQDLKAELRDGTLVDMKISTEVLNVRIVNAELQIVPYIIDWIAYDLILGKPWLSEAITVTDWKLNRISIRVD